jgi:hypothetical protein
VIRKVTPASLNCPLAMGANKAGQDGRLFLLLLDKNTSKLSISSNRKSLLGSPIVKEQAE